MDEENFFDKFGLEVKEGKPELGHTYPIYGMITKIVNESIEDFIVEVNYNIKMKLSVSDVDKINIIKGRAFEPGIFISTFDHINNAESLGGEDYPYECSCVTVVFGKKSSVEV